MPGNDKIQPALESAVSRERNTHFYYQPFSNQQTCLNTTLRTPYASLNNSSKAAHREKHCQNMLNRSGAANHVLCWKGIRNLFFRESPHHLIIVGNSCFVSTRQHIMQCTRFEVFSLFGFLLQSATNFWSHPSNNTHKYWTKMHNEIKGANNR